MAIDITSYKDMLSKPWGKIMYELIFAQLTDIRGKKVLDFGAGFGLTAQHLAENGNEVVAIEPEADMLFADDSQTFTKILGSFDALTKLESQSFDVIICHNVLEYVDPEKRPVYFKEFERLLKSQGQLSLIKHNQVGKVIQAVVFSNDIPLALDYLEGKDYTSQSFSSGSVYTIEDLAKLTNLSIESYRGLRTFYALQPNEVKSKEGWLEDLLKIEMAVCDKLPYKDIAFLQHVRLRKGV